MKDLDQKESLLISRVNDEICALTINSLVLSPALLCLDTYYPPLLSTWKLISTLMVYGIAVANDTIDMNSQNCRNRM